MVFVKARTLEDFPDDQPVAWQSAHRFAEGACESVNGPGSDMAQAAPLVKWLPDLFHRYNIHTILDAPCGDWNWMQYVSLEGFGYLGWDSDPKLIEFNREHYGPMFECVNILKAVIPRADVILCRDYLAHLPNEYLLQVLDAFRESGSTYLLASTYPGASNERPYDPNLYVWSGYYEMDHDLEAAPFNLGPKLECISEAPGPAGVLTVHHELALFALG
jgi:hypothetical protein